MLKTPVSDRDHIHGNPEAKIELVQYGDYQCPFCWKAYPIVQHLKAELGDRLKFVFRNFALTKVHPHAKMAAIASEAAGAQGKFWEMHDLLYENHKRLNKESLLKYAEQLSLDMQQFEDDLCSKVLEDKVDDDFLGGLRSGVNATPTFFINGEKYEDSWEENNLLLYIWASGLLK